MPRFKLTEQHIALLRQMNVGWDASEYGAPNIDPKRPYGNSDVVGDIREIVDPDMSDDEAEVLHNEIGNALSVLLACGQLSPGTYVADAYKDNWRLKEGA